MEKYVFLSESCLPASQPKNLLSALFSSDKSWLRLQSTPNNGYANEGQWMKMSKEIPPTKIRQADQWIALSAREAKACVWASQEFENQQLSTYKTKTKTKTPLWRLFKQCSASDELYFPTLLAILNLESHVEVREVTFVDWEGFTKNPRVFESKDVGEAVRKAKEKGCVFMRKIKKELKLVDWESEICS